MRGYRSPAYFSDWGALRLQAAAAKEVAEQRRKNCLAESLSKSRRVRNPGTPERLRRACIFGRFGAWCSRLGARSCTAAQHPLFAALRPEDDAAVVRGPTSPLSSQYRFLSTRELGMRHFLTGECPLRRGGTGKAGSQGLCLPASSRASMRETMVTSTLRGVSCVRCVGGTLRPSATVGPKLPGNPISK